MKPELVVLFLVAVGLASPSTADAQASEAPGNVDRLVPAVTATADACVEPSDALARRRFHDEPCRWPRYRLPAPAASDPHEARVLPHYPRPPAGAQAGHAMFWRLPVQPRGPYDAPRQSFP